MEENGYIKLGLLLSNNEAVKNPGDLHRQFQKPILLEDLEQVYPGHYPRDDLKLCSELAIAESMKMYHVPCNLAHTKLLSRTH